MEAAGHRAEEFKPGGFPRLALLGFGRLSHRGGLRGHGSSKSERKHRRIAVAHASHRGRGGGVAHYTMARHKEVRPPNVGGEVGRRESVSHVFLESGGSKTHEDAIRHDIWTPRRLFVRRRRHICRALSGRFRHHRLHPRRRGGESFLLGEGFGEARGNARRGDREGRALPSSAAN